MNRTPSSPSWQPVTECIPSSLEKLLRRTEWAHCAFSSRIIRDGQADLPQKRIASILTYGTRQRLSAALYRSRTGLVLPVFEPASCEDLDPDYLQELRPQINSGPLHTVMGLKHEVALVESIVQQNRRARVDYYLMKIDEFSPQNFLRSELEYRQATTRDLQALMPLQSAYEKEEVLLNPENHDPKLTKAGLYQALRHETVVVAEVSPVRSGSRPVNTRPRLPFDTRRQALVPIAKAATNACGFDYCQIGGVYTACSYRGRGIGTSIVGYLLEYIFSEGKRACLFVKRHNQPAIAMYKRLGFTIAGDFRIVYY